MFELRRQSLIAIFSSVSRSSTAGLQQYYVKLKDNEKNRKLFELLDLLEFNQVLIFVKTVQRCMALAQLLVEQNFPAIAIHRAMIPGGKIISLSAIQGLPEANPCGQKLDAKTLNEVQDRFDVNISELPDKIDISFDIKGR
ncbi:hypothetical protein MRX96_011480 [Rhipicephalus microplus]